MPLVSTRRRLFGYLAGLGLWPGAAASQDTGLPGGDLLVAQDGKILLRLSALSPLPWVYLRSKASCRSLALIVKRHTANP